MSLSDLLKNLNDFVDNPGLNKDTPPWVYLLLKSVGVMCVQLQTTNEQLEKSVRELKHENEDIRALLDDQKMYCRRNYLLLNGVSDTTIGKSVKPKKVVLKKSVGEKNELYLDLTKAVRLKNMNL